MKMMRTSGMSPYAAGSLLLVALGGLAGCGAPGRNTDGAVPIDAGVAPGATGDLAVGDRLVRLRVPRSYDSDSPAPLVVALHGYGGDAEGILDLPGLVTTADDQGFLLAAPEGTMDQAGRQFWDATDACCNFYGQGVDDSKHLARVIDAVARDYAVDPARVFVLGISNGGFMAHRLACDDAEQVAAIVSIAGAQDGNAAACEPARPVSVLQVHGTADEVVPFDGGALVVGGPPIPPVKETVAQWRVLDHCAQGPGVAAEPFDVIRSVPGAETVPTSWHDGCDSGTEVALWKVVGGGHDEDVRPGFSAAMLDWLSAHARTSD